MNIGRQVYIEVSRGVYWDLWNTPNPIPVADLQTEIHTEVYTEVYNKVWNHLFSQIKSIT